MSDTDFSFDGDSGKPDDAGSAIDPSAVGPAPDGGTVRKRRTRSDAGQPRGPRGSRKAASKTQVDLSGLTAIFVGMHVQLAAATNTPELAIQFEEGDEFLKRAQAVMSHYSVETTQKTIDWLAFAGVAGMMYGTRYIAINNRHRQERLQRRGTGVVVDHPSRRRVAPVATVEEPPVIEPATELGDFEL